MKNVDLTHTKEPEQVNKERVFFSVFFCSVTNVAVNPLLAPGGTAWIALPPLPWISANRVLTSEWCKNKNRLTHVNKTVRNASDI